MNTYYISDVDSYTFVKKNCFYCFERSKRIIEVCQDGVVRVWNSLENGL